MTAGPAAGPPRLVLASQSPARLATLRAAGLDPVVLVSGVDEDAVTLTDPAELGLELAQRKAAAVAASGAVPAGALVVGCDSVLELDGEALGKPGSPAEAVARWQAMRGRSGVLHTGHHVIDTRTGAALGAGARTTVHFAAISDEEVEAYVGSGEPLHVAGAFTLDGLGGAYVTRIEGDPHNVVGISLPLLRQLLGDLGIAWHSLWRR